MLLSRRKGEGKKRRRGGVEKAYHFHRGHRASTGAQMAFDNPQPLHARKHNVVKEVYYSRARIDEIEGLKGRQVEFHDRLDWIIDVERNRREVGKAGSGSESSLALAGNMNDAQLMRMGSARIEAQPLQLGQAAENKVEFGLRNQEVSRISNDKALNALMFLQKLGEETAWVARSAESQVGPDRVVPIDCSVPLLADAERSALNVLATGEGEVWSGGLPESRGIEQCKHHAHDFGWELLDWVSPGNLNLEAGGHALEDNLAKSSVRRAGFEDERRGLLPKFMNSHRRCSWGCGDSAPCC